ncbi:hypothetical protein T484DRAFT_3627145 [Baffinella frigidus]|nr:hypothetical protein T484DRAFT_3627145 [Cryptophyta sp. CCMP2293]
MAMPHSQKVAASAGLLAGVCLLVVAFTGSSTQSVDLMGRGYAPRQLANVDPDMAGADIYSIEASQAKDLLKNSIDEQKRYNAAARSRMFQREAETRAAKDQMYVDACNRANNEMPGCPYVPAPVYMYDAQDPEAVGDVWYAVQAEQATRQLEEQQRAGKEKAMRDIYDADVARYEREWAQAPQLTVQLYHSPYNSTTNCTTVQLTVQLYNQVYNCITKCTMLQLQVARYEREWAKARVYIDACDRNNNAADPEPREQLWGCPYHANIRPPQMPADFEGYGSLVYAKYNKVS